MWAHALRRRNPAPGEQLRKLTSALVRAIGGASLKVDQCRREIPTRCLTSAIMEHFGPSPPSTASGAFIEHQRRAALTGPPLRASRRWATEQEVRRPDADTGRAAPRARECPDE